MAKHILRWLLTTGVLVVKVARWWGGEEDFVASPTVARCPWKGAAGSWGDPPSRWWQRQQLSGQSSEDRCSSAQTAPWQREKSGCHNCAPTNACHTFISFLFRSFFLSIRSYFFPFLFLSFSFPCPFSFLFLSLSFSSPFPILSFPFLYYSFSFSLSSLMWILWSRCEASAWKNDKRKNKTITCGKTIWKGSGFLQDPIW